MLSFAWKSLWNRRFVALLTVLSMALSVALILGVDRLRGEARASFANSASGIDLIVAARDNPVQILMATIFGLGSTSSALDWDSFEMVEELPGVDWAVPVSMGDNHRGYPVIGTKASYFDHFRHSGGEALVFRDGVPFSEADGAVVGAEVAARFGYETGTVIVNAHGSGSVAFDLHDEAPFIITGILSATGTAVDRMVFVSLEGFDALHAAPETQPIDPFASMEAEELFSSGEIDETNADAHAEEDHAHQDNDHLHENNDNIHIMRDGHGDQHHNKAIGDKEGEQKFGHASELGHQADKHAHDEKHVHENAEHRHVSEHVHEPAQINAVLVGLSQRTAVLGVQRAIMEYPVAPLTAVLPNVALLELWSITGTAERAMFVMAWAVAVASILCMVTMLSAALDTRRREFAILRSVGATPVDIFGLIVVEATMVTCAGIIFGFALCVGALAFAEPMLASRFGIRIDFGLPNLKQLGLVFAIFFAGLLASLIPAWRVYRITLADGLSVRL
ncbi:ABC transporter permease [Ruegeria profundi]|uniref:ABC transporter permease n=1 Tax=Ruegeria profundi TaxID=1685378 RepID=A0A0X3TVZ8_9RHOB|nr:ABC transporter permease [Ruegeria profundi]KUJ79251.1 hypothetical protein AVO44_08415 [Ruegeria profundi]